MGKWFETSIGDQATLQRGYDITKSQQRPGSVPVISSGGFSSLHDEAKVKGPGVILGRKGLVGSVYFVSDDYWPHDTTLWVKNFHSNDRRFVYYFFRWFAPNLASMDVGSSNPTLNRNHVHPLRVLWPPLGEQKLVAALLGALDDKIDLNRRMNETLEAMARAIFKDWFFDFGPTRAKAEGRTPYLAPEIWDLFPDALDDEDKPVGWNTRPLNEFFHIVGGGTPKTSVAEYWGGDIPWFSVVDTPAKGSVFVVDTEKNISERGLAESSARLVPLGTTIISARGTVGNLAVAAAEMTFNQSCYALGRTDETGDCFVYLAAQHLVAQLQAMAHGSVFPTITRQTFEAVSLAMPAPDTLAEFEQQVSPLFQRIRANVFETRTLAQTRDLLLPKLMSGEIRLAEAAKTMEAVA